MLNRSFIRPLALVVGGLPVTVLAHPGHGGGSALQHDWQHALWFGAATAVVGWAVWGLRAWYRRER